MKRVVVLEGNYGNAGLVRGAEIGASDLKHYIMSNYEVEDGGNLPDFSKSSNRALDCIDEVKANTEVLAEKVRTNLNDNKRVFTVGGDHSIAVGSIYGASEAAKKAGLNFGVIYIDAHGDINTCENSVTKNIHGMPLAYAVGAENYGLQNLPVGILDSQNLLCIGTRSLDKYESDFMDDNNIHVISSEKINNSTWEEITGNISAFVRERGLQRIHLSIDIDTVDPAYAPGTGVPEENGILPSVFLNIVSYIMSLPFIHSVELVEFNPTIDVEDKTKHLCHKVCSIILDSMATPHKDN